MRAQDRGFALLIVLWTMVLLTLIVSQLGTAGRSETRLARNLLDAAAAEEAADAGIFEGIVRLLDPDASRHWAANGRSNTVRVGRTDVDVRIDDDSGKINPNIASLELIGALLHEGGADSVKAGDIAADIVKWRFPTAEGQVSGIDTARYRASGLDYAPPEAPFETVDEVKLVLGMTPELFARIRSHLTVDHDGDPDPRSADPIVLLAIQAARGLLVPPIANRAGTVVTISSHARTRDGATFLRTATLQAGVQKNGGAYRIFSWN